MRTIAIASALLVVAGCATRPDPPSGPQRPVLSLDEIFRLHRAGVGSKVVVAKIQASEVAADLSVSRIIELKEKGLPDDVLEALVRATEIEEPREVIIRRYGPSYWGPDPWYYRYPYVY